MSLLMVHIVLAPSLMSDWPSPLRHGQSGILDEVLLFAAPLVVVLTILMISSRRRRSQQQRVRARSEENANLESIHEGDSSGLQGETPTTTSPE